MLGSRCFIFGHDDTKLRKYQLCI